MTRVAFCNNMVSPYTNRLFNYIATSGVVDLHVVSCTAREKNRNWTGRYAQKYDHIILKGIEFALAPSRIVHINIGMWRTLNRLKPDVVSINGIYPTMLVAVLWSLAHRIPFTFSTDGWRLIMPRSIFHRVVRWFVFGRCQAAMCIGEKGRRFLVEEGIDPKRVFVSHLTPAWDAPAELPAFDRRPFHLLWCGHLAEPPKNPAFFVSVVMQLKKRIPDLRVRIVGDGPLRQKSLDDLSNAGVNFEYSAFIPPEQIAPIFATARMLAFPSTYEAWGLVCNEAMQCGTPCIVSRFTGVADDLVVNEESGFVHDLDVDQWVETIARVTTDRASWTAMSEAVVRSIARFDLKSSGDRYIEAFVFAARQTGTGARGSNSAAESRSTSPKNL